MPKLSPTLVVLAAGLGSRYGGLKQMEPLGPSGESILDYSIYDALRAGFGKAVFVISRGMEQPFKQIIGSRFSRHLSVEYVFQELEQLPPGFKAPEQRTKPWGTTHAVLMAAGVVHQPFAVINADDFYGAQSYSVLAQLLLSGAPNNAMVGFILRNTLSNFGPVARGVCRINSLGYLESVTEFTHIERVASIERNSFIIQNSSDQQTTILTGDETVSMNMWGFSPEIFPQLQQQFQQFMNQHGSSTTAESYLPEAVNALTVAGQTRIQVLPTEASWFGVTYRQDHANAVDKLRRLVQQGVYPERLWP